MSFNSGAYVAVWVRTLARAKTLAAKTWVGQNIMNIRATRNLVAKTLATS